MTRAEISQAIINIVNEIVPDEDWSALEPEENLRQTGVHGFS